MRRRDRRMKLGLSGLLLLLGVSFPLAAQQPAPTLIPPTLVPTPDTGMTDALVSESAVARIQANGRVRVGILYNVPPFGLLNIRGAVAGFDADLARSMADAWGVEAEFVQVTRQTALDLLTSGQVDILAAAMVHQRELDNRVEFSHTYYRGSQAVMVRQDDGASVLAHMADRKLGVVIGTASEQAVQAWQVRSGMNVTVETYYTLEQGLVALVNQEIDGLVSSRYRLRELLKPGVVRILDEPLAAEPYAIALRRQDVSLRDLVNRTLQYLAENGRLNEIYASNFPGSTYPSGLVPIWLNLGDEAPRPDQFESGIPYPTQYVIPRLQDGQPLRVAGIQEVPDDAPESEKRLNALNRAVVERLAARWGGSVEYLPNSVDNALDLVASGQADVAVGAQPDWAWADRVDFSTPYLVHGDRLMVKRNSDIESFNELRGGKWVGIFASEPGSADKVNELARSINTAVNIYTMIREQDVPFYILEDKNADVAFGDSLKLIPHIEAYPDDFRLTTRCPNCDPFYTRDYVALGLPRNDLDFRLLVEYTLQEMAQDGTLASLWQPVTLPDEVPEFDIWPGPAQYLGFNLRGG
ncbi:MAG: transporter substrate-binding domain-containing protein [Anaerolineae bacterium]|nr:transporter substrate-binding domain-containing protein [Anaerolineae bacterium]